MCVCVLGGGEVNECNSCTRCEMLCFKLFWVVCVYILFHVCVCIYIDKQTRRQDKLYSHLAFHCHCYGKPSYMRSVPQDFSIELFVENWKREHAILNTSAMQRMQRFCFEKKSHKTL